MSEGASVSYPDFDIRPLTPADTEAAQTVLVDAWEGTYVETGLMTRAQRRRYIDASRFGPRWNARLIAAEQARLRGDDTVPHLNGAFTDEGMVGIIQWYPKTEDRYSGLLIGNPSRLKTLRPYIHPAGVSPLGYIEELDVVRTHRRRKVGAGLVHAALLQMADVDMEGRELAEVHLDVVYRNIRAKEFYRAIGMHSLRLYSYFPDLEGPQRQRMMLEAMAGNIGEVRAAVESCIWPSEK